MHKLQFFSGFALFLLAAYGILSGLFIIRQNEFRLPFTRNIYIEGQAATLIGVILTVLGLYAGWMLYQLILANLS